MRPTEPLWVDDQLAPAGSKECTTNLSAGLHTVTLRIDPKNAVVGEIKVEINKPSGSSAEFTVVGVAEQFPVIVRRADLCVEWGTIVQSGS